MIERITINQAIVVEGKYDKIKLSSIFNAVIIPVGGFSIYKDKEKLALLRHYSQTVGVIILTDSDSAGFRIRGFLKGALGGNVKHVYIPDVFGKEKRKIAPSAEGKLGVEGMDKDIIIEAFKKSGISMSENPRKCDITKLDLYNLGLSGNKNSVALRQRLLKHLNLPELLSANAMLEVLNTMFDSNELEKEVDYIKSKYIDIP